MGDSTPTGSEEDQVYWITGLSLLSNFITSHSCDYST